MIAQSNCTQYISTNAYNVSCGFSPANFGTTQSGLVSPYRGAYNSTSAIELNGEMGLKASAFAVYGTVCANTTNYGA